MEVVENLKFDDSDSVLTLEKLMAMEPKQIIATGIAIEDRLHYNVPVKWVARRGGIHDWVIYYGFEKSDVDYILAHGDKVFTEEVIRRLVPCTQEAFDMYRK